LTPFAVAALASQSTNSEAVRFRNIPHGGLLRDAEVLSVQQLKTFLAWGNQCQLYDRRQSDEAIEQRYDLRAEVTLHALFGLTRHTRGRHKKPFDVGSGIGPVQWLVVWVVNVIELINRGIGKPFGDEGFFSIRCH
jgi:hypothetical protein